MRLGWETALLFAVGMLETFSRPDFALVLAGVRRTASGRELDRLLDRWRQQQIVTRIGRGQNARFRIKEGVRNRIHDSDPVAEWGRCWDGKWRVFSFDLPASRRKERMKLWRQLRAARFGLLQRSVWIWPHDVEASLRDMVGAVGIPECFCGFEAGRLLLCDTKEIVASSWDWKRIRQAHTVYLQRGANNRRMLQETNRLEPLARIAKVEHDAYREAFRLDPFLPRGLLGDSYQGFLVQECHGEFQKCMRERIHRATPERLP